MSQYFKQTRREKQGAIDGIGLFFGALLGANLGTIGEMPLNGYFQLIVLLAFTVMVLRIISTSERRGYAFLTIGLYVLTVPAFLLLPGTRPEGLSDTALARLLMTLAVWVSAVLLMELWPTLTPAERQAARAESPPP